MSEIKTKIEAETKDICSLIDCMESTLRSVFSDLGNADTHEVYEAVDIFKDLTESKKNIIKSCYYTQILEAMEDSEYGKDYNENGKMWYGENLGESRTMPHMGSGSNMGYSENMNGSHNNNRMYSESRYERAKRGYSESTQMNPSDSERQSKFEHYKETISTELAEMVNKMSTDEKAKLRQTINAMLV